jgi:multiple sugar transport system permease protein
MLPPVVTCRRICYSCAAWDSFARICLPLIAPAIVAAWLLCLAFIWNEWMYASALWYTDVKSFPVLIQATGSGGGFNLGGATTRALTATVEPLVAALHVQRFIVRALSLGPSRDRPTPPPRDGTKIAN